MTDVPGVVVAALAGPGAGLVEVTSSPLTGGTGAATASVDLIVLRLVDGAGAVSTHRVVRKVLRPVCSGRHAAAARREDHWAYWRREALAYASGLLPTGTGLAAPRLIAVDGDAVYLDMVEGEREDPAVAARRLGEWQAGASVPSERWLTRHQLAQRVAVTCLDWDDVDADERLVRVWERREELLTELESLPITIVHGDYSAGNIVALDGNTTVAIDWATFGVGPVGADLASLTLSTGAWLLDEHLAGLDGAHEPSAVRRGYEIALALSHASRAHWALSRQLSVDPALTELVLAHIDA